MRTFILPTGTSIVRGLERAGLSAAPGFELLLNAAIERTRATFRIMVANHVALILGSDTPAGDGFGNPPGLNGRLELQGWADAGAPLPLLLRAATLDNATALGLSHEVGSGRLIDGLQQTQVSRRPCRAAGRPGHADAQTTGSG